MRSSRCPAGWADRRQRVINEKHATGVISYPAPIVSCNTPISATTERRCSFPATKNMLSAPVPGSMFLVTESEELPGSVLAAYQRAASAGFQLSCEMEMGRLLAALAAAVPRGGRVLEIGTGVGVGWPGWSMAWERARTSRSLPSSSMMRCSRPRCQRRGRRGSGSSQVTGPRSSAAWVSLT
jgi:hypothetical protein